MDSPARRRVVFTVTSSERSLMKRSAAALALPVFFGLAWCVTGDDSWALIAVVPAIGAGALIVTPSLSSAIGDGMTAFMYRPGHCEKPHAPFSQVDTLVLNEEWDAAELMLTELARRYPDDGGVWMRLFRVVWRHLDDRDRAREAHELLLATTTDPTHWQRQTHLYLLFAEDRLGDGPEFQAERTAALARVETARRRDALRRRKQGWAQAAWARRRSH